jgi:hypothetical protein
MAKEAMSARQWIACVLLCALGAAVACALTEATLRWRARHVPDPGQQREQRGELLDDGLPERDAFLRDRRTVGRQPLRYHDYHIYSLAPMHTETITITDYFGARLCPDSVPDGLIVWFLGGSTMQNLQAPDRRTIANQAVRELNAGGVSAQGVNFGVGSFQSSIESIKFQDVLRRAAAAQRPCAAVFYDGFNDAVHSFLYGAGNLQTDVSAKLRAMVERDRLALIRYGLFQLLSEILNDSGFLMLSALSHRAAGFPPIPINDGSAANLDKALAIYADNVQMIAAICATFQIQPLFVLQPLVVTKQGLGEIERQTVASIAGEVQDFVRRFYAGARSRLADRPDFVDLSGVLDDDGRDDFYDLGHTGPFTGETIGHAIAQALVDRGLTAICAAHR